MASLTIPHKFRPREYQLPFFRAMDGGKKRAVLLNHRRAGKDKSAFNYMVKEAMKRVGVYYYFFPTYNQGRKILWDGIDKDGFKFLIQDSAGFYGKLGYHDWEGLHNSEEEKERMHHQILQLQHMLQQAVEYHTSGGAEAPRSSDSFYGYQQQQVGV